MKVVTFLHQVPLYVMPVVKKLLLKHLVKYLNAQRVTLKHSSEFDNKFLGLIIRFSYLKTFNEAIVCVE